MSKAFSRLDLTGRIVLVTGGSSGIGLATSHLLASRGASIVLADLDRQRGHEAQAAIEREGGAARFIETNVANEGDVAAAVEFTIDCFGGLHGAFNNAGLVHPPMPFSQIDLTAWQKVIDVNLTGVFLCMKHELRHMEQNGGGSIVNASSGSGVVGTPYHPDYVASKHGVIGLTRTAAAEYAQKGIRVNAVLPGPIDTPMVQAIASKAENVLDNVGAKPIPIGRIGQPQEVGEAVAWLLSDAASYATGGLISVDGAYTAI